jgi:hypothetical protein
MMRRFSESRDRLRRVALVTVLAAACGSPPPEPPPPIPFKPVADLKQLMVSVIDPAADVIWGSVGTIVSADGTEERAPKTDDEWAAVLHSAFVIAESGNLMMMAGRARDTGEWMRYSQQMIDVGVRTIKAAEARDKDAIFTVGGDIYEVCANCHRSYTVQAEGIPR